MSSTFKSAGDPDQPMIYQIRIKGHLGREWTDWFEGLTITLEDNGETLLTGALVDQAALFGLLRKVRDVGLPLLSVSPVYRPGRGESPSIQLITCVQERNKKNENNEQDHRNERQESHAFTTLDIRDVQFYVCGYSYIIL